MIPKWFLRSRFWFINLYLDEYISRDSMAILMATLVMQVPVYLWGLHCNRESEITMAHTNYSRTYAPRRNRLAHSMVFEEFELHTEAWRELAKGGN